MIHQLEKGLIKLTLLITVVTGAGMVFSWQTPVNKELKFAVRQPASSTQSNLSASPTASVAPSLQWSCLGGDLQGPSAINVSQRVRVVLNDCGDLNIGDYKILNATNGFEGTLFQFTDKQWGSDYVDIAPGNNRIVLQNVKTAATQIFSVQGK